MSNFRAQQVLRIKYLIIPEDKLRLLLINNLLYYNNRLFNLLPVINNSWLKVQPVAFLDSFLQINTKAV